MDEYRILQFAGIEFPFHISFGMHTANFPVHTHDFTELTIVTAGSAIHEVEGVDYPIGRGEVYIMEPSFTHALKEVRNLEIINFIFDLEKLMLLDSELKKLPGFQALFILEPSHRYQNNYTSRLVLDDEKLAYVISICRNIQDEFDHKKEGYKIIIKTYFLSLISFISRNLVPDKESISDKYFRISKTITLMEENFAQRITLQQLSQMVFLSERQYSRIFKEIFNMSPIEYLINTRLNHAAHLVCTSQLTMKEIAERCGFGDKVSFSRLYKKKYKMTPGQYRKTLC